jgi:hypothetical protein
MYETEKKNQKPKTSQEFKKSKAMKTSILVSSTAALCLLLTFAEAPKRNSAENNNANLSDSFTYIPSNLVYTIPAENLSAAKTMYAEAKTKVKLVEDFNYLKFNVADYEDNDEMATEVTAIETSDRLKFDVTEYASNTELTSFDALELPVNEFAKLKFDVSEYASNTELTSFDALELPVNEFANLKFDVTEYASNTELTSFDALELPVNEFEYLKFDVTKFADNDEITELPVDEYSYLRFDANKYNTENALESGNFGELPANE